MFGKVLTVWLIAGGCLILNQLVLAIYIVRNEVLGFWAIGRVFNEELILLLPIDKRTRTDTEKKLIAVGRTFAIVFILCSIYLIYLIRESEI